MILNGGGNVSNQLQEVHDMNLSAYFETTTGMGVLATANPEGMVDAAIYARPHVVDNDTIAFIMGERRSFANLTKNPHAAYLYREDVPGYKGVRLYLTKTHIETDPAEIESMRRKKHGREVEGNKAPSKYLVYFHIDEIRPLVGDR